MKKYYLIICILAFVSADRLLKHIAAQYKGDFFIVGDNIRFGIEKNTGIAMSLPLPIPVTIIISVVVLVIAPAFFWRRAFKKNLTGFFLIIAGGFSNLFDRIVYGYVIDYFAISLFGFAITINAADVMIVGGVILLILKLKTQNVQLKTIT